MNVQVPRQIGNSMTSSPSAKEYMSANRGDSSRIFCSKSSSTRQGDILSFKSGNDTKVHGIKRNMSLDAFGAYIYHEPLKACLDSDTDDSMCESDEFYFWDDEDDVDYKSRTSYSDLYSSSAWPASVNSSCSELGSKCAVQTTTTSEEIISSKTVDLSPCSSDQESSNSSSHTSLEYLVKDSSSTMTRRSLSTGMYCHLQMYCKCKGK